MKLQGVCDQPLNSKKVDQLISIKTHKKGGREAHVEWWELDENDKC